MDAALGLDIGSTNTKAVLTDPYRVLTAPTPTDPDELIGRALRLAREAAHGVRVGAVGVASMAETGVPLDRDLRPLTPLLRWDASRGDTDARALSAELGAAAVFAATGVRLAPKTPLSTWRWLRRTGTPMHRWAGVADLVALALTGTLRTDHTLAGRTGAWRLAGGWDAGLLAAVGVEPQQLPEVGGAAPLRAEAAAATGLRAGTPVLVAGHDHQVGAWAAGVRGPGAVADSLGTAESLIRPTPWPAPEAVAAQGMSLVRTVGGHPALVAGSPAAGAVLDTWYAEHAGRDADRDVSVPATPTGRPIRPYPRGRQCPRPDPTATLVVPDGADAASVYEGLALHTRWMYQAQSELALAGAAAPEVTVIGGHRRWVEFLAAVLPVPVRWVEAREPVATGAALLAAGDLVPLRSHPMGPRNPLYDKEFRDFLHGVSAGSWRTDR